jgi:hypothetical protein
MPPVPRAIGSARAVPARELTPNFADAAAAVLGQHRPRHPVRALAALGFAIVLLASPAQSAGMDLNAAADGSPVGMALLVYSAVANTLVMNLPLWPVLLWGLQYSGGAERRTRRADARARSGE